MYGGGISGLGNRATGDQLSSPIGNSTAYGTFDYALTEAGPAAAFDGTSNYVEYSPTNIPTNEFTLLWGGVFDANDSPRGLIDCTNNGVSGWNVYQNGTDGMYFNNSSYPTSNGTTGWTVGQFWHGALRNKGGVSCDWFRNGAKIYTGSGVSPTAPTLPLWIGRLKVGANPYIKARFSYLYLLDKYIDDETISRIAVNPYIIFAPQRYVFDTGTAAAPGSVALTGQTLTSAVGILLPSTSKSLTGQSLASAQGTLAPSTSKVLSGQSLTSAQGSLTPSTTVALTGQSLTASQGSLTPTVGVVVALTGQQLTSSQGSLSPANSVALAGQSLTSSQGTLTPQTAGNVTLALTGQALTGSQGNLAPANSVALSGQSLTSAQGSVKAATSIALSGQSLTGSQGTLTPVATGQSITIQLTGQSLTSYLGSLDLSEYIWDTDAGVAGRSRGTFKPLPTEITHPEVVVVDIPERESTYEHHPLKNVRPTRVGPQAGLSGVRLPRRAVRQTQTQQPQGRDFRRLMMEAGNEKKTRKLSDYTIQKDKKYLTKARGPVTLKGN